MTVMTDWDSSRISGEVRNQESDTFLLKFDLLEKGQGFKTLYSVIQRRIITGIVMLSRKVEMGDS